MKELSTIDNNAYFINEAAKPAVKAIKVIAWLFLVLFLFVALFLSYKGFTASEVGNDAGYYLSVSARIVDGWIPFKDLFLEYSPLGMYFYALVAAVSPVFKIENYYLVTFLFMVAISIVVYLIALNLTGNRLLAAVSGTFNMAVSLYCQGYLTLLEPFTVFFYLSAIFLVILGLKKNSNLYFIAAGFLLFLSFFSKQFGLLVLPAIFVYILMSDFSIKRKFTINLLLFAGFCFCASLILTYFYLQGVELGNLAKALSGSGAGNGTYGFRSVSVMLNAILRYLIRAELFLGVVPILLLINKEFRTDKNVIFLLILNLCAFLPLYFADFTHYYQLIVPFSSLLGAYIVFYAIEKSKTKIASKLILGAIAVSLLVTTFLMYKISFQFEKTNFRYTREEQLNIASSLQKLVPPRSQVFMVGAEEMYALCNYLPVEPAKFGYMFQSWFTPQRAIAMLKPGQYIIIPEYNFEKYKPHVSSLTKVPVESNFQVYRR